MKVCLISEGSYPMVRGGLSEWAHQLVSSLPEIEFEIICVMPNGTSERVYETPPNVTKVTVKPTISSSDHKKNASMLREVSIDLANSLRNVLYGKSINCEDVIRTLERYPSKDGWLGYTSFIKCLEPISITP